MSTVCTHARAHTHTHMHTHTHTAHVHAHEHTHAHTELKKLKKKSLTKHLPLMVSFFLQAMYYLFIYITKTSLEVFRCEEKEDGKSYLKVDPGQECAGPKYQTLTKFAALSLVCYSLSIPIAILILLNRNREKIKADQRLWSEGKGASKECT